MRNSLDPAIFNLEQGDHRDRSVIWIRFPKDALLLAQVKALAKPAWSASHKAWYVADNAHNRSVFGLPEKIIGKQAFSQIHAINLPAMQRFQENMRLRALSPNTLRTYSLEFAQLLYILKNHLVDDLGPERLRSYFLYCIDTLKLSENHLHSRINAVKFYFEQVLKREKFFMDIPRPKKPSLLPKVLDKSDVLHMLAETVNIKHRVMLKLCYGMGLRVSEVVGLRITHIDSKRMQVLVQQSKGKKDRYVNLPHSVLEEMRDYFKEYKPKDYLFEGAMGDKYSVRSVQAVFKTAMRKANINKQVGIHSLRHSYATHLMEQGTDIQFIQRLLGHNDIKTTLIYTHVADKSLRHVKSPLDE